MCLFEIKKMSFRPEQLQPNIIKVTPRRGIFGQHLAVWATGYDYPLSTFLWNIAASRAGANQTEVDAIVNARISQTGETYDAAYNSLVLESGMFKLQAEGTNDNLLMDAELVQAIRDAAQAEGISPADYLRQKLGL